MASTLKLLSKRQDIVPLAGNQAFFDSEMLKKPSNPVRRNIYKRGFVDQVELPIDKFQHSVKHHTRNLNKRDNEEKNESKNEEFVVDNNMNYRNDVPDRSDGTESKFVKRSVNNDFDQTDNLKYKVESSQDNNGNIYERTDFETFDELKDQKFDHTNPLSQKRFLKMIN